MGIQILKDLGLSRVRLLTNNPIKRKGLEGYDIEIVETLPLEIEPNEHNRFYLETKRKRMGHFIDIARYENTDRSS